MNKIKFLNIVMKYLKMEYGAKYRFLNKDIKNLISAYYWGGNSVPETARAVVDYINSLGNVS